jgi:hypothetical protein
MNAAPKAVTMFERINTLLEPNLKKILNNELHNEDRNHCMMSVNIGWHS